MTEKNEKAPGKAVLSRERFYMRISGCDQPPFTVMSVFAYFIILSTIWMG